MYNLDTVQEYIYLAIKDGIWISFSTWYFSDVWLPNKKTNKFFLVACIISMIYYGGTTIHYVVKLNDPIIDVVEGTLVHTWSDPRSIKEEYSLEGNDNTSLFLKSDVHTLRELFPEGVQEDVIYRVYYEKDLKIIVGVEEILE